LKRSNRLVLLVGVFLAVIAFVGIALLLGSPNRDNGGGSSGATPPPVQLPTVIANKDIPLGVVVTQDMLTDQTLPVDQRRATAFQADGQVIGLVARRAIKMGAQLEAADFDTTSTSCGTIDVPTTLRAIAVQTDQVSGVGTVINTGDYIDMLVGFTGDKFPVVTVNPTDNTISVVSGLNGTSVKLLLEGMQVLCRQLPPPAAPPNGQQPAPTSSGNPNAQTSLNGQQEIVIVGVTATQAEVIKFAQLDGSISLVLRSRADFQDAQGNPITAPPSGSKGITLKKLTTDFSVPIPELVEAILPAQPKK
jgi:Flp pilus assembly protein CpaB